MKGKCNHNRHCKHPAWAPAGVLLVLAWVIKIGSQTANVHKESEWVGKYKNFGFIKRVDKGWITIVKGLES